MACILVLGTGRSGTSLLVHALERLGVHVDAETVPPSDTNPLGTGEAKEVRDQLRQLHTDLGGFPLFRPPGWQDSPRSRKAVQWMAAYLKSQQAAAKNRDFAIKFPLSSLFIPLWIEAAGEAGVSIKCVWAIRRAPHIINSMISAYEKNQERYQRIWAQRTYYILRDAPAETPLIHFEDWASNPNRQVARISELLHNSCQFTPELRGVYISSLDHSKTESPIDLPESILLIDDFIQAGKQNILEIKTYDETEFYRKMTKLADILLSLSDSSEVASQENTETRIELLKRLAHEKGGEEELITEIGILSERFRSTESENARLYNLLNNQKTESKESIQPHTDAINSNTERESTQAETIEALREEIDKNITYTAELKKREKDAIENYLKLTVDFDRMEEEIESRSRYRLSRSEAKVVQLQNTLKKVRRQLADAKEKLEKEKSNNFRRKLSEAKTKLTAEKKELAKQLASTERALIRAQHQHKMFLNSTSWRITSPMRKFSMFLRGFR
ncbi:hypothetical protein [Roseivivax halodurans]|uniref:hypothetical protein n=1 Tax=Roseivivax halodurans TaxID=93683 RepID=UPI0004AF78C5|nr:hypothetical protein [Roseivivax halodurans]